ncbi:PHP domain protein [Thermovibrio ammonificans HB-1]|uniref:PHP domain protein n=1 Tax=Thermovibrio ammonificans (strain DSM 15698 / JCM 12110 / HB-1) TaxID=648996 RepID=E8T4H1_THEA1|nr:PHP domain protein [Thermovibrio ammonificans HB-1]
MRVRGEKVDLHSHSTASDGTFTPSELVELAHLKGITLFSLTDHDTVDGLPQARLRGRELGVNVIPGIEVTADTSFLGPGKRELHILGYYFDPDSEPIRHLTAFFKESRIKRNKELLARLEERGFPVTYAQMVKRFGENFGKPNIARVLIDAGFFTNREQAIDFLSSLGVKREKMDYRTVLELITEAGGLPVIAHPVTTGLSHSQLYCFLKEAKEAGLKGVEVYHYRHTPKDVAALNCMAKELGLFTTAGSDFHGANKPCIELGFLNVTTAQINFPNYCQIT